MKTLLFICHEFHQTSRSHEFMLEILEQHYAVSPAYLSPEASRDEGCLAAFTGQGWDVVLCWQVLPPMPALARTRCAHLVFFPMFDQSGRWSIEQWIPYRGLRIFSFSRTLARQLCDWGFDAHYFQFFPEPGPVPPDGNPRKAFFWNRSENINLRLVTRLLSATDVRDLHVHKALDPGQAFIPAGPAEAEPFHMAFSSWFATKAEMSAKVGECAIYFAPRAYEGIGLSFLEAMAMGRCVIAPDHPTMNEYIVHGMTGFLYDPKRPAPLALGDVARIQRQTREFMVEGYQRWQAAKGSIVPMLEFPARKGSCRPWFNLALNCLCHPFKVSRRSRQWLFSIHLRRKDWRVRFCGRTWSQKGQFTPGSSGPPL